MTLKRTALILIGFQNDYFAEDGVLRPFIASPSRLEGVLSRTLALLDALLAIGGTVIVSPIRFTPDYSELVNPIGILKAIQELGAFRAGSPGVELVAPLQERIARCQIVPGRRGLSAFSSTRLATVLEEAGVDHIVLAGVVTSICIDSTGRAAAERGHQVTILSDCTAGRTPFEDSFYRTEIFPMYARVETSTQFLEAVQ